jgi:hypothetical protein
MTKRSGAISVALVVSLVVLVTLAAVGVSLYGYAASIRNQALAWETDLNSIYRSYENEMATYVNTFYEQTGLANLKSDKMNELIRNAMQGRYGDNPKEGNLLFKAVAEAYPSTDGLNIYDKILPTVSAGREALRNKQNMLIERAQKYNYWRKEGIFRAWVLNGMYPSRDLQIKVGGRMFYGEEALNHLSEPITNTITEDAFQKQKMEPLKVK